MTYSGVSIKKIYEDSLVPTKGSKEAAGYDLYAHLPHELKIYPHDNAMIKTGIAIELPIGTFGAIFARSGLASKRHLRPSNCVGVIDSDYRGEILVPLHNDSDEIQFVQPNERIAQLIIIPYIETTFIVKEELNDTKRGDGGFGSTGTK